MKISRPKFIQKVFTLLQPIEEKMVDFTSRLASAVFHPNENGHFTSKNARVGHSFSLTVLKFISYNIFLFLDVLPF